MAHFEINLSDLGLEYVTEIQIPGEPPCFYCELCDARFSNNLKFAHVTGSKHRYKVIVSHFVTF